MNLNKKGRDELRAMVEKELRNVSDEQMIELNSALLDTLLFETIVYKKKPKRIVKLPVWSGSFLRKLDLSKVSFKDVSWSLLGEGENSELGKQFFDDDCWQAFRTSYGKTNNRVDYSGTNIVVNFNQSWEMNSAKGAKVDAKVRIVGCDFSDVDLSQVDASKFLEVRASSFANTNLVIPKSLEKNGFSIFFYTNLSGIDLGKFMVTLLDIITIGGPVIGVGCNLSNTRLSILLDPKSISDETSRKNFKTVLMSGDLDGCFINGKRVLSYEEKKERSAIKLAEYEKFKENKFDAVKIAIQKQIGKRK